ncbi:hypothetical protein DL93DRAFT_768059 [Clavulina sp. PMI_390]|nr:hypothetical protein DL93DRAFT_768059 [Clavulina sp. PMI_390]
MHAHANTQTNHYFYDPVPRKNHRDDEPLHPEMRCWRFFPTQNNSHSMAMTLHLTAFKSEAPFPQIPAHPDSRFTLHTSESTAGRSHEQVILASVITSDADIPSTSDQDGTVEFQHALSVAGRSTLLSLLQVPALKQDLLLLSHSPTASRTTAESDQNWRTRYRPVHLRTQDGRPREIPTFGFGSTRKYLWNEHTGQIVVVTPEQSSCTMVRVYQI